MDMSRARRCLCLLAIWSLTLTGCLLPESGRAESFDGRFSGSWWTPGRDGEGQLLSFERVGERRVAVLAWFTYDGAGRPRWLVGSADYAPGSSAIDVPLVSGRGARFGVDFRSEAVRLEDAGRARIEAVDCDHVRLRYGGEGDDFELMLQRASGPLEGAACAGPVDAGAVETGSSLAGLSGSWWDPERSGEGSFLAFERAADGLRAALFYFTYDASGEPRWLVGSVLVEADTDRFDVPLITGRGGRFGPSFDAGEVVLSEAGYARVELDGCDSTFIRFSTEVNFAVSTQRAMGPPDGLSCERPAPAASPSDLALRPLLAEFGLTGDPAAGRELPGIDAPLAQLGKLLFFSRTLSAAGDVACATCHHPALGGADGLAVSVGTPAEQPEIVGPGRLPADGILRIGRNANTFFNSGLFEAGLFWDSRVERLEDGGIATPDSAPGTADPAAGDSLLAAQARFPVLAPAEMLGDGFPGLAGDAVRQHLAARLGDYGTGAGSLPPSDWLRRFRAAFGSDSDAESLIRFDTIAQALAAYQRSALFVDSAWARYVRGNNAAVSEQAKAGALVFLRDIDEGGAQCVQCHRGDLFTDEKHHVLAFPQVGPGLDAERGEDGGRGAVSGIEIERFAFRTPGLLNVALTAPYGHSGAYRTLEQVINHYRSPAGAVSNLLVARSWCRIAPFDADPDCAAAEPQARARSREAMDQMQQVRQRDPDNALPALPATLPFTAQEQLAAFLRTLTDPCLLDRSCFGRWIPRPEEAPDDFQLEAVETSLFTNRQTAAPSR